MSYASNEATVLVMSATRLEDMLRDEKEVTADVTRHKTGKAERERERERERETAAA